MPDLAFGIGAYARERGNLPELPVINMVVESTPASANGIVLQSRPGLVEGATVGSGPILAMYQRDGALGGNRYAVSGTALYRDALALGTVTGTGPVSIDASDYNLLVTRGAELWAWDGVTYAETEVVDAAENPQNVTAIAFLAGYEVALIAGTNKWQFRLQNAVVWDGLDFANAENEPDRLLDVLVYNDSLIFFGSETVEFWPKTGDSTAPFAPESGRVFEKGVIATGCATRFDNTFAWIGNEKIVYLSDGAKPVRISDAGIEERLGASTSFRLYRYFHEGIECLVARMLQGTWVYSAASRQWSEFQSYGRGNWRASCAIAGPLFGDDETGKLWTYGAHVDAGGVLERRFRAAAPITGGTLTADNVRLTVNVGETPNLTGDYANPVVEMRTSRDAARTFGDYRATSLGAQGKYRTLVEWRRCGMFDAPGMVAEFRCTDPVPFRLSAVKINEQGGGRSR